MLEAYNKLKDKLLNQGFDKALSYIDSLPLTTSQDQLLKTNFYVYLSISQQVQLSKSLSLLQGCLNNQYCRGGIRALTRYHVCQIFFAVDIIACQKQGQQLVQEFIGSYHMLEAKSERTKEEEGELWLLQYLLYYCLLMLGYLRSQQGRTRESQSYTLASINLLKINNMSSQFIHASSLRTRSAQQKKKRPQIMP